LPADYLDVTPPDPAASADRESCYDEVLRTFGPAVERLARAYEADRDKCRDLLQDIHLAIWRSLEKFDRRCSLRTWVYRVAHNTAVSYVTRQIRFRGREFVTLDELDEAPDSCGDTAYTFDRRVAATRLRELIQQLAPLDRQIMICYLEGLEADAISDLVGMSRGAVAMKVHRVKRLLALRFHGGGRDGR
jgi:RNA polymerase sigma-70 factor (ECF subfamily)